MRSVRDERVIHWKEPFGISEHGSTSCRTYGVIAMLWTGNVFLVDDPIGAWPLVLPEHSGVAERVAAGLRIHAQPVRAVADLDARQ